MAKVSVFNRAGQLVGPVESPDVRLSDAEWQAKLTPPQFQVLRHQGTERAFCGTLLDNKKDGVYTCAGCGLPLFASNAKFNSGTGWPSFFQPIATTNVLEHVDSSHGMRRVEIVCARCEGHLGHVFDDGPAPTGQRHCLNSESLNFTSADQLATLADPAAEGSASAKAASPTGKQAQVVFAGGCFWCTEAAFEQLVGVSDVESGYTGGAAETADYKTVCTGTTGHAEVIRITYDPSKISYDQLLDVFFDAHDPTQLNRQGNDAGTQYRSAIFYADDGQKQSAQKKIDELNQKKKYPRPIVTTLEPLKAFYPAEDYHQGYAQLNPNQPYIAGVSFPKVCKIRDHFPDLIQK
jgi:peptide methionine sulfoxide reductase msrA/msrB